MYDVQRIMYLSSMYVYIRECCCRAAALSVVILLLLLYQRLLFVIVCRIAKLASGSLNLISSIVFVLLIIKDDLLFLYLPLGSAVAFMASISLYYILGNYGHAQGQGGRHPVAAKPPLYIHICIYVYINTYMYMYILRMYCIHIYILRGTSKYII